MSDRDAPEAYDDDPDHDCPHCGGEGFVANCWEEFACIDPEGGCDDCTEPCDFCNSPRVLASLSLKEGKDE